MKKSSDPVKITEGEYLRLLYDWSGEKTQTAFVQKFKRSRDWYRKAIKYDIIPMGDKYDICRAYGIPIAYFKGGFDLPTKLTSVSEPPADYSTPYKLLEEQNKQLTKRIDDMQQKYIDLVEKYTKLLEEKKEPA